MGQSSSSQVFSQTPDKSNKKLIIKNYSNLRKTGFNHFMPLCNATKMLVIYFQDSFFLLRVQKRNTGLKMVNSFMMEASII